MTILVFLLGTINGFFLVWLLKKMVKPKNLANNKKYIEIIQYLGETIKLAEGDIQKRLHNLRAAICYNDTIFLERKD